MLKLQALLSACGVDFSYSFLFNEALIQRGRNALVASFLKTPATILMFIDADIQFEAADLLRMIQADRDVLCGVYPKKEINWASVRRAIAAGVPDEELKYHTGVFVVKLIDNAESVMTSLHEPLEIWEGGTGFMMIKRQVFEKLAPLVPWYINDIKGLGTGAKDERISEFFSTSIDETSLTLRSEDYHFCYLARLHGFKIHAALWAQLSHIGTYLFEGRLLPPGKTV
jgi:hypothetical protein